MRNSKSGRTLLTALLSCCLLAGLAYGDSTTGLTVLENGNTGIGTATPQASLDVNVSADSYIRAHESSVALLNLQASFMNAPLLKIDGTGTADLVHVTDSASPVLSIKDGGNIGIGTTSPAAKLEMNVSNSWDGIRLNQDNNTNGNGGKICFVRTRNGGSANAGNFIGAYGFMFKDSGGNTVNGAEINSVITDNSNGSVDANMNFLTAYNGSWGNRMTLTSNGNFGIGTMSPSELLHIQASSGYPSLLVKTAATSGNSAAQVAFGTTNSDEAGLIQYNAPTDGNANMMFMQNRYGALSFRADAAGSAIERMRITTSGNIGIGTTTPQYTLDVNGYVRATNVSVSSDIRLKENVKPIPDALDRMARLQGVSFNWKDRARGEGAQMGVIAQDVEKVFPEAVLTDSEGYKSVSYTSLVAPLVEAVKQLKAESDNLRSENDHLRARLEALEKKIKD